MWKDLAKIRGMLQSLPAPIHFTLTEAEARPQNCGFPLGKNDLEVKTMKRSRIIVVDVIIIIIMSTAAAAVTSASITTECLWC